MPLTTRTRQARQAQYDANGSASGTSGRAFDGAEREVSEPPEIPHLMEETRALISTLDQRFSELQEKLEPYCVSQDESGVALAGTSNARSQMGMSIQTYNAQLSALIARMIRLQDRLEV